MAPLWARKVSGASPSGRATEKWNGSRKGARTFSEHWQGALEQGTKVPPTKGSLLTLTYLLK